MSNKIIVGSIALFCFLSAIIFYHYSYLPINWSKIVSQETIAHSWGTWRDYFSTVKPGISYETFMHAIKKGEYKTLSIEKFLQLNVQNQRLAEYRDAKSAQEMYPPENRPRGQKDIDSVNYFLKTQDPVSPITVARVHTDDGIAYIKLDGVHRLMAAALRKSPIKILFIDL